jgi:hypothetical protein
MSTDEALLLAQRTVPASRYALNRIGLKQQFWRAWQRAR